MTEPWFTVQTAGLLGGLLGGIGGTGVGLLGAAAGVLIPRGIGARFIAVALGAATVAGLGLLLTGLVALALGQPAHVSYSFLLAGVIFTIVCGVNTALVVYLTPLIEARRMAARELRGMARDAG